MSPELVKYLSVIGEATWQTLVMVLFSTIFSMLLGIPLGILLCTSDPAAGLRPKKVLYQVLSVIIDIDESLATSLSFLIATQVEVEVLVNTEVDLE